MARPIPAGKALKRGDRDSPARLDALARVCAPKAISGRLGGGDSSSTAPTLQVANVYDRTLAGAVAQFQARHSIGVDSMLGKETVDAMNVPADYRLAADRREPRALSLDAALARQPLHPRERARSSISTAFDSGQKSLEMKVIVGQEYEDKATPVFSDSMEYVVFRPYWNVTPDDRRQGDLPEGRGGSRTTSRRTTWRSTTTTAARRCASVRARRTHSAS